MTWLHWFFLDGVMCRTACYSDIGKMHMGGDVPPLLKSLSVFRTGQYDLPFSNPDVGKILPFFCTKRKDIIVFFLACAQKGVRHEDMGVAR